MSEPGETRRYEVRVLLGPCSAREVEDFVERMTDTDGAFDFGAVWTVGPAEDEGDAGGCT